MNETIGVRLPDGQVVTRYVPVKYTEDDIDIARRMAKNFPSGTVLTVDGNRFKVMNQEPPEVVALKKKGSVAPPPSEEPEAGSEESEPKSSKIPTVDAQVGQRWVTKDSRRKQDPFEIVSIDGGTIVTDKGARIGVHRLNRYKLVS